MQKRDHIPSLDGLRTISITLVILHHLVLTDDRFKILYDNKLTYLLIDGHLGVNLFFVISGFLITTLLLDEEKQKGTISIKNFYQRRFLRIFPAFYTLLFFYLILQSFGRIEISAESYLTAFTYFKYLNWENDWYTAHAWSLSIEEQFYLLWPLFFFLRKHHRLIFLYALVLGVPLLRIMSDRYQIEWMNHLTIFLRIDAIATGCLLAYHQEFILKHLRPYLLLFFLGSLLGLYFLRNYYDFLDRLNLSFLYVPFGKTSGTFANVLICFVLLFSIHKKSIWSQILNSKCVVWIGSLSYGLYLWQQFFISETLGWIHQFPQNILLTLLVTCISFYLIEKPFLKLKRR